MLILFVGAAAAAVFGTVIVALTCVYVSLESHKFDYIIEVSIQMSLPAVCVPGDSSFISIEFLVLKLVGWFVLPSNKFIIFYIPLLDHIMLLY